MLSISHAVTGSFLANTLPSPLLSIPSIILSHYALDAVYHYDAGTGLSSGRKTRKTALILGIIDLALAAIFVSFYYPLTFPTSISQLSSLFSSPTIYGAFFGLLPDFLEAPRNFLHHEPKWLKPINKFHNFFHHSTPNILVGLAPQIILLIGLWFTR